MLCLLPVLLGSNSSRRCAAMLTAVVTAVGVRGVARLSIHLQVTVGYHKPRHEGGLTVTTRRTCGSRSVRLMRMSDRSPDSALQQRQGGCGE